VIRPPTIGAIIPKNGINIPKKPIITVIKIPIITGFQSDNYLT
jgi:hypothetical protein